MHASASVVPHLMTHFDTKEGKSIAFAFSLDARIGGRQNLLLLDEAGGDWREGGDIAFNELVKECLFVHGWNERKGGYTTRTRSSLLCPIMYKYNPEWNGRPKNGKKKKGSLGFSVEGVGGEGED